MLAALRAGGSSVPAGLLPVVHHELFSAPQLSPGHRFPMQVFGRIAERLLACGDVIPEQVARPDHMPSDSELALVHDSTYLAAFSGCALDDDAVRRIGFGAVTRTPLLVSRTKAEVAGTLLAARLALQRGLAVSTAGGTHHAHRDAGSGFCILNDLAYTAHVLLSEGTLSRVLILDLDVHQGDGTAAMCADTPGAVTVSVHAASNFPARKVPGDVDVALPDGMGDAAYLALLGELLPALLRDHRPQLVLYDAGVDVHVDDALGRLALSDEGANHRVVGSEG